MILIPFVFFLAQEPLPADAIMARVAENQDRAEQARAIFVYHQDVLVRLNRSNGKLAREEYNEYAVTPTPNGITRERQVFRGKYMDHGQTVEFDKPGFERESLDADAGITKAFSQSFGNDKSRDGIDHDLFPFTAKEQPKYDFHLEGAEDYLATPVYRITFEPNKRRKPDDDDECWAGEALVQRDEFQPVLITTHLAEKIPMWVRAVLGTDVKAPGFKVTYKKFDEGLWFPVTYGGEFQFKVLLLYSRNVGLSIRNSGFQRAAVDSSISYANDR
jgi:hypothetical protein